MLLVAELDEAVEPVAPVADEPLVVELCCELQPNAAVVATGTASTALRMELRSDFIEGGSRPVYSR